MPMSDVASAVILVVCSAIIGAGLGDTLPQGFHRTACRQLGRASRATGAICAEFLVMAVAGVLVVASIFVGNGDG